MLKDVLRRILAEPLSHFLAGALALFLIFALVNPSHGTDGGRDIVVTRNDLLVYMQFRARAFDPDRVESLYNELSNEDRNSLIEEYVRDEAMYREAQALHLGDNDFTARRRLIQQLEFVIQEVAEDDTTISEDELQTYFAQHRDRYTTPATITFTHVFFSDDRHGATTANALARRELARLNAERTPFHEAMRHGDRALFQVNYVQQDEELVASHFGAPMARQIFELEPNEHRWRGPYRSLYGAHLVLVTGKNNGQTPTLDQVRERVLTDALTQARSERLNEAIDEIVATYRVHRARDLEVTP